MKFFTHFRIENTQMQRYLSLINAHFVGVLNENWYKKLIKRITETQPKPMGRWNVENCDKKLNQKIDLSNEDHCGPCGQYRIDKLDEPIKNPNKKP